jgi:hypothetical protein
VGSVDEHHVGGPREQAADRHPSDAEFGQLRTGPWWSERNQVRSSVARAAVMGVVLPDRFVVGIEDEPVAV